MKVLLVEDLADLRLWITVVFSQEADLELDVCASADEALALDLSKYDAVICDLMLPGKDGGEVLGTLKNEHPEVRRIIWSAKIHDREQRWLADVWVPKPSSSEVVIAAVRGEYGRV